MYAAARQSAQQRNKSISHRAYKSKPHLVTQKNLSVSERFSLL